jgi:hypothetical protein
MSNWMRWGGYGGRPGGLPVADVAIAAAAVPEAERPPKGRDDAHRPGVQQSRLARYLVALCWPFGSFARLSTSALPALSGREINLSDTHSRSDVVARSALLRTRLIVVRRQVKRPQLRPDDLCCRGEAIRRIGFSASRPAHSLPSTQGQRHLQVLSGQPAPRVPGPQHPDLQ